MITLHTTHGDISLELDTENTPKTAANFLEYAQSGFYEGTIFHRVIDNFMIQGGGFEAGMTQKKPNAPIKNEAKGAMPNKRGTIAMARTSDPDSATCQFFINVKDNAFLDGQYCVFGSVVSGMDVIDKIKTVPTTNRQGHGDVPVEEILIERVTVSDASQ
jgi:peptidyl-prolyl cis-trans isomerase B (cyclophilin B)